MRNVRRVLPILIAAALVMLGIGVLAIQQNIASRLRYFPETNHIVREPFLSYFDERGGVVTFGSPLTDAYITSGGTLVQTFQCAHLQLTLRGIELAPVGRELYLGDGESGHAVADEFLTFYENHGGEAFFGVALGAAREENGLLVQDFERARLERNSLSEVRLANLGSIYLAAFPPPEYGQAAFHMSGTPAAPPALRPNVSVEQPAIGEGGQQTIYLYVEDDGGNPVAGVQSLAILRYDNATAEVELSETDENGLASATFIVPPALPGAQVIVEMHLLFGEIFLTVQTAYFQWW